MSPNPRPVRASKGFTLVELLVVIGIIALLISILLPSLNQARQQAKTVQCMSNLRQIGIGVEMYKQQFNAMVPAWVVGPNTTIASDSHGVPVPNNYFQTWPTILYNLNFVKCPTAKSNAEPPVMTGVFFCPEGRNDFFQGDIAASTDSPFAPRFAAAYRLIGKESANPAIPEVIIDSYYGINASTTGTGTNQTYANSPSRGVFAGTNTGYLIRPNRIKAPSRVAFIYDGTYMDPGKSPDANTYRINGRHGRNRAYTNIVFCDGHAETVQRAVLPQKAADFSTSPPVRTVPAQMDPSVARWRIDQ